MEIIKQSKGLAAFDYDGTLAAEGGAIKPSLKVRKGINELWEAGIQTTLVTSRPYQRLETITGGIGQLVSHGTPIATDRGARVIAGGLNTHLSYTPLDPLEINKILDIAIKEEVQFIGFYPKELWGISYIWSGKISNRSQLLRTFGHDAIVLPCRLDSLREALREASPCLVTIKLSTLRAASLIDIQTKLNTATSQRCVSVIASGVNKLAGLQQILAAMSTPLEATSFAGNDLSDLPILTKNELRERLFVGENQLQGIAMPFVSLATPEDLGDYLIKMAAGWS